MLFRSRSLARALSLTHARSLSLALPLSQSLSVCMCCLVAAGKAPHTHTHTHTHSILAVRDMYHDITVRVRLRGYASMCYLRVFVGWGAGGTTYVFQDRMQRRPRATVRVYVYIPICVCVCVTTCVSLGLVVLVSLHLYTCVWTCLCGNHFYQTMCVFAKVRQQHTSTHCNYHANVKTGKPCTREA